MKKRKTDRGLWARLAAALVGGDLPVALPGEYYLELSGGAAEARLLISGADRLVACTEGEILLLKKGKPLRLLGEGLHCLTYGGGVLEVKGNIYTVLIGKGAEI